MLQLIPSDAYCLRLFTPPVPIIACEALHPEQPTLLDASTKLNSWNTKNELPVRDPTRIPQNKKTHITHEDNDGDDDSIYRDLATMLTSERSWKQQ